VAEVSAWRGLRRYRRLVAAHSLSCVAFNASYVQRYVPQNITSSGRHCGGRQMLWRAWLVDDGRMAGKAWHIGRLCRAITLADGAAKMETSMGARRSSSWRHAWRREEETKGAWRQQQRQANARRATALPYLVVRTRSRRMRVLLAKVNDKTT